MDALLVMRLKTQTRCWSWNQIFIDTLVATTTPNSSSQRLGAIVHTAIFDAYNGIEQTYTPIFVHGSAPPGASRRAAVIAAAHTALVGLFRSRQPQSDASYKHRFAGRAERRWRRRRSIARPRHRLGKRGGAGRARLARGRWLQRQPHGFQRRHGDWAVAAHPAAGAAPADLRKHERAGFGLHLDVRPRQRDAVSASSRRAAL